MTPAAAHSAASQASQARAGRSVFGPVSWPTTSGCTANAPSASAITHPGVRSARSPTTPAARASTRVSGVNSVIGTIERAMPVAHAMATSSVSG